MSASCVQSSQSPRSGLLGFEWGLCMCSLCYHIMKWKWPPDVLPTRISGTVGLEGSSLPRHSLLHFQHTKRKLCYKEPTPIPTSQDTHSCQKSVYRAMAMRDAYKGSFRSLSFWCTMHTLSLSLGHFMSSVFMICMCYVRMCYVCAMYVCMYLTLDCLCTYVCVYVSVCVNTVLKYSYSERSYSL